MSVKVVNKDTNSNRCDIQCNAVDVPVATTLDNGLVLADGSTLWEMDGAGRYWVLHNGAWVQKA